MLELPPATAVTTPDVEPIVATAVLLLLHVPPGALLASASEPPAHIGALPVIAGRPDRIVIEAVAIHPVGAVYVMVTDPADTPVTAPALFTVATVTSLLLHVPPVVASV
jgi:hypothetical protein